LPDVQQNEKTLGKVQEYEEAGGRFKINGHLYYFRHENKAKNKYYACQKRLNAIKCRGSITLSPNREIVNMVAHTCDPSKNNNPPIIISVDGYSYSLNKQYKNKSKYFRCRKFKTEKCGGSIILSPNETVVRKQFHTCSGICKV